METKPVKKNKTYKDYYQNDEEYRTKQKKYLATKIKCECGAICARSYLAEHRKKPIHAKRMGKLNKETELNERRNKIEARIAKLEKELVTINKHVTRIAKQKNNTDMITHDGLELN
jgi:phosphatidate phosphatase PAH1